jgi:formate dehydrogenase alpha subunit
MSKGKGRTWETEKVKTICPYCGTGCSIFLHVKDDTVTGVSPCWESPVNRGELCVKGRFGWDFIHSPERLKNPLIKKEGQFIESTWEEALQLVAEKLTRTVVSFGADSLAGLGSARCTNEENFLFQKLLRMLGTNNIDHCARLCHAPTVTGLSAAFGSGAMTNSSSDIEEADCLLIIGSNTTETHPVIGYRIRKALSRGAGLVLADPRRIALAEQADIFLQHRPGTDVALLNALMNVILEENLEDRDFIQERTECFQEMKDSLVEYTPEQAETITGVPAEAIRKAARLYAGAENASILYTMGITQHISGTDNVKAIANLAMITGNLGKPGSGVNPLRGQNNVQGACDMGVLPAFFCGYRAVSDPEAVNRFSRAWDKPLSSRPGLTIPEMIDACAAGTVKAMYIMGENPLLSDADITHVKQSLQKLEFLVVQDIFLTETAMLADVVLPAASFAEKDGTFTNTERRVQLIRAAIKPRGESKPDWEILTMLACKLGLDWRYNHPKEIMEEIASLTPSYAGVTYQRLETEGLQWPCPGETHPGTPFLHKEKFTRGLGRFHLVSYTPPEEQTGSILSAAAHHRPDALPLSYGDHDKALQWSGIL